jgi:hypothetical protein
MVVAMASSAAPLFQRYAAMSSIFNRLNAQSSMTVAGMYSTATAPAGIAMHRTASQNSFLAVRACAIGV